MGNKFQFFRIVILLIVGILSAVIPLKTQANPTTGHDSAQLRTAVYGRQIEILNQRFEIGSLLGSGEEGHVFEAMNLATGELVAVKLTLIRNQASRGFPRNPKLEVKGITEQNFSEQQRMIEQINSFVSKNRKNTLNFLPILISKTRLSSVFYDLGYSPEDIFEFAVSIAPLIQFSLFSEIQELFAKAANDVRNLKLKQKISLAFKVYSDILNDLSVLASANFGHFDLKPENIGYHSKTKRFSILDWGALRPFSEANEDATENVRFSKFFGAPETVVLGEFSNVSDLYSLGNTLISILIPGAEKLYLQVHPNVDDVQIVEFEKLKKALEEVKAEVSKTNDQTLIGKMERLSEFILASVIVKPAERKTSLLKTRLPQKIKQLLAPTIKSKSLSCGSLF